VVIRNSKESTVDLANESDHVFALSLGSQKECSSNLVFASLGWEPYLHRPILNPQVSNSSGTSRNKVIAKIPR